MRKLFTLTTTLLTISSTAFAQSLSEEAIVNSASSSGGVSTAVFLAMAALFALAISSGSGGAVPR